MSNDIPSNLPPNLPPGAIPPKKGLGPLAWTGIGCGGVLLLGIVIAFVLVGVVGGKVKNFIQEAEKNPAKVAAEMAIKFNPELEMVSSDETTGSLTFRERKTGKETTLSYEDISNGNFSIKTDGQEININAATEVGGSGSVVVKTKETKTTWQAGESTNVKLPAWVSPFLYPQASEAKSNFATNQGGKRMGNLTSTTSDTIDTVAAYYKSKLEKEGFSVSDTTFNNEGQTIATVIGTKTEPLEQNISVSVMAGNEATNITLIYHGAE